MSRKLGVTEQQLLDLGSFETSPAFNDLERLVLRFSTGLSQTPADVSDELFSELRQHFNEKQMVELTSAIAWENYRARFNRAFDIAPEGFTEGSVCAVPALSR